MFLRGEGRREEERRGEGRRGEGRRGMERKGIAMSREYGRVGNQVEGLGRIAERDASSHTAINISVRMYVCTSQVNAVMVTLHSHS